MLTLTRIIHSPPGHQGELSSTLRHDKRLLGSGDACATARGFCQLTDNDPTIRSGKELDFQCGLASSFLCVEKKLIP